MRFSIAALVAGFAATSSAFLLPPNVEDLKDHFKDARFRGPPKHFKDLIHALLEEKTTSVDLECPGCPYAAARLHESPNGGIVWEQGVENAIHLEFDTHDDGLNVNGHPLFPLERAQQSSSVTINAHQIKKNTDSEESIEVPLSFALEVLPSMRSPHREDVTMIPMEFTVLNLDGVVVKVNTVALKVIKTPENKYVIVHAEQVPFEETPGADTCDDARSWTLCRIKAIIASRIRKIIELTKEKTNKVHGWMTEKTSGCKKGHGRHGPWGRPHPNGNGESPYRQQWKAHRGRHHGLHRLGHVLRQTLQFFVIPALVGIIVGLTASAIGILVGQAIIYLWFRTYRRGQRGPLRIYEREITLVNEEQEGLLGEKEEVLPVYEDSPKYEETMTTDVEAAAVDHPNEKQ